MKSQARRSLAVSSLSSGSAPRTVAGFSAGSGRGSAARASSPRSPPPALKAARPRVEPEDHPALVQARDLRRVGEAQAAGARAGVDDDPVEDVGVLGGEHVV